MSPQNGSTSRNLPPTRSSADEYPLLPTPIRNVCKSDAPIIADDELLLILLIISSHTFHAQIEIHAHIVIATLAILSACCCCCCCCC